MGRTHGLIKLTTPSFKMDQSDGLPWMSFCHWLKLPSRESCRAPRDPAAFIHTLTRMGCFLWVAALQPAGLRRMPTRIANTSEKPKRAAERGPPPRPKHETPKYNIATIRVTSARGITVFVLCRLVCLNPGPAPLFSSISAHGKSCASKRTSDTSLGGSYRSRQKQNTVGKCICMRGDVAQGYPAHMSSLRCKRSSSRPRIMVPVRSKIARTAAAVLILHKYQAMP